MPGKVGVKIKAGRNLPVMDRGSDTTDAYVEIKLGNVTHKTDVCRKSLNPQWNTDWFRFEVDDAELQDEPLQIRLMDHDTYSANDAIGKVYINLNPLCLETASQSNQGKGAVMSGWIPVFDTMHGIRGEVNIIVKVDLFSDANKFRQSSCGIQFFYSPNIPHGYKAQIIHGFVEELVVNDDPEYQWIDKIRTPRASNEARQVVFLKLSGQVQRKIGLKAINLGANAVIGYTQCFDLEGDVGVVARGIGTAVTLVKIQDVERTPSIDNALIEERTLKYFEFLKGGGNVDECYKSVFDCGDMLNYNSGNLVYKILGIDPSVNERSLTKTPNVVLNRRWKPNSRDNIIIEESENETPEGMTKLLRQEDMRGEKPTKKFHHHVKRITRSSRSLFTDKLNTFRTRNSEEKLKQGGGGSGSLNSSTSDVSYSESVRNSLTDLRGFIKFRRRKGKKETQFNRSISDGTGMASLLVNSIIRGPSMDQISEGRDSVRSTPSQKIKFRKNIKSESTGNLSQNSTVDKVLSSNSGLHRQDAVQSTGSVISSSTTTTVTSSTTAEEDLSEDEDVSEVNTPNEIVVVDADTVSMVVKTVLAQEEVDNDSNNWIYPGSTQDENDGSEEKLDEFVSNKIKRQKSNEMENIQHDSMGKICISTGAARISRKGKKIESEIVMKESRSAIELDSILKQPSADEDANNWIQPGSTTDEPETVDERKESIFTEIKETLQHIQEHIHLPHFTDDKLQKLRRQKTLDDSSLQVFSEKLHRPKFLEQRRGSLDLDTISKKLHFSFGTKTNKHDKESLDESSAVGNAIKSILMEPLKLADEIEEEMKGVSSTNFQTVDNKEKGINFKAFEEDKFKEKSEENKLIEKRSHPIIVVNEDISYYSSEPELANNSEYDGMLSPFELNVPPFISLTNLNTASSTSSLLSPLPKNNNNLISSVANNCFSASTTPHYSEIASPYSPLSQSPSFTSPSIKIPDANVDIYHPSQIVNLKNARNNILLSSSDTSLLSTTNKAQTLAPFPYLKQHRSELAATTTAIVAVAAAATPATTTSISTGVVSSASPNGSGNVFSGKMISINNNSSGGHIRAESVSGCKLSQSPAKIGNSAPVGIISTKEKDKDTGIYRRSSDSDLSVTPKGGNSLCIASERLITATSLMRSSAKVPPTQENLDMLEYPFLTMAKYPPGFILHLGATVAARSVKLLERVPNPDEPETRDSWWTELRMEIRSHARALSCNVILGYSEETTISDDVCVLSATGTAAVINMSYNGDTSQFDFSTCLKKDMMVSSLDERDYLKDTAKSAIRNVDTGEQNSSTKELSSSFSGTTINKINSGPFIFNFGCSICHIPYSPTSVPFNVKMKKCSVCKRGKVPDVLLATIEIPDCLQITGRGCFMQAQVVRTKKDLRSESNAKEISDGLPFLEYELHRLLINKLKAKGMNAIFGLKAKVAVGEKMMALIATGTAIYLTALPPPTVPKIVAGNSWTDMAKLKELQKSLQETVERNREIYQLKCIDPDLQEQQEQQQQNGKQSDTDDSDDEIPELDLTTGNKDTCVLEVDDIEDLEIISLLMEPCPPEGFHVVNTQSVPGLQDLEVVRNLRMFTQIWRAKLSVGQSSGNLSKHFQRLLQTIFFKLRTMIPCAICDLRFQLDLPEHDEIQVLVTGMALGLGEISKFSKMRRKTLSSASDTNSSIQQLTNGLSSSNKRSQDDDLIFSLDEDQQTIESSSPPPPPPSNIGQSSALNPSYGSHSLRLRKGSPSRMKYSSVKLSKHVPLRERYGVDITPLSYVPGGKIEKYLGNLNFFFIRESTSIRENGGISGFVHSFITELLGVIRAHVTALGGNAMVSFYMTELLLVDNQHKNQGQCLISIGGDVVHVSYFTDE